MFINPKHAIKEGWITGIKDEDVQVQPNAIDFTLDRLFSISDNEFIICADPANPFKEMKQMRGGAELSPYPDRRSGIQFFNLDTGSYDILSDVYVEVPEGMACLLVTRSTFVRNGLFLVSGLYDSGFKGHIGCVLHNLKGTAKVQKGTRVGQVIFVSSETAKMYAGGYNHEAGTNAPHIN
jgi:deoxycytidine triphosphate deaminase